MNAKLVNSAAGVILAALTQNRTAAGIALSLDSAQLLLTPETTAELERLQLRVDEVERAYTFDTAELKRRIAVLEAERHTTNEALDDAVQALRADRAEPAAPPVEESADRLTGVFAPVAALREDPPAEDVSRPVAKLRALLAGQREAVDGEHYAAVHHSYRTPRDLPGTGGAPC